MEKLTLKQTTPMKDLEGMLRQSAFRGLYSTDGQYIRPYKYAKFSRATIHPQKSAGTSPEIIVRGKREPLFTSQPTIYENQTQIMKTVDDFLLSQDMTMSNLRGAVEYHWEGRGDFHILPPIIERHVYHLRDGFVDLERLSKQFLNTYIRDACGNLHHLKDRYLNSFYVDEVSKLNHFDIFNSNAPIINYGLGQNNTFTFYIVCDGAHRVDYILEKVGHPINAILVEPTSTRRPLYPYYAFPVPNRPTIRLSSKRSEKMYHRIERDKIHLLNDLIKKTLHYNWGAGGLKVGSLRNQVEIY